MTAHLHPSSWAEAAAVLAEDPHAVVLAGGTGLQPWLTASVTPPSALVHLDRIADARTTRRHGDALRVGALVRVADPALGPWWGSEGAGWFATPAVRRRATLVGNLASALGPRELAPVALATGGVAETWGRAGVRTVPVADLIAGGAGRDLVAAVVLQVPTRIAFERVSARARMSRVELGLAAARGPGCGAALVAGTGGPALPVAAAGAVLEDADGEAGLVEAVVRPAAAAPLPDHPQAVLAALPPPGDPAHNPP
ncbi:FAD binding domain-containing protein, partial [Nocardioides sp. SYSU DS0663]|uniref:FAD binding domain-containing protein n=1 Tax=Nocardioides sp. SYSU DS0663 TaxID=3416445 RepID=UPI003F4B40FD